MQRAGIRSWTALFACAIVAAAAAARGLRTNVRAVLLSANYAGIRGPNGLTFLFGNRRGDGTCCVSIPGFSNILVSDDARKNWFDAMYLTAERPFDNHWASV